MGEVLENPLYATIYITTFKSFMPSFIERTIKRCRRWVRVPTSQIRLMPDFIIIGAQRAGTTSLYKYLTKHPHIAPATKKEVHFFDKHFHKSAAWYRSHFASQPYRYFIRQIHKHGLITGEASPYYILHPLAPQRMVQLLPQVKLLVMLRNPIDRAYSHYWHEVKTRRETLSFEEAIHCESSRLQGERQKLLDDETYSSVAHQHFSYLARGIYVDQLKVWRRFFPQEQFLILNSQDFYTAPAATLKCVFEFLNLPNWELSEYKSYNRASYPPMNPDVRTELEEYFQPHNERLYEYLGTRFDWN